MTRNPNVVVIRMNGPSGAIVRCVDAIQFTIGRVGADVILPDKGVSRLHLTVIIRGNSLWLEDMNSANGSFVGTNRLMAQTATRYENGQPVRLGFGKDILTFELIERAVTLEESAAEAAEIDRSPSKALSISAPNIELADQADAFLREARGLATSMRENAARDVEQLINSARGKASEIVAKSRTEADKLYEEARHHSSETILAREAAAEEVLRNARKEALTIKTSADEEAERINKSTRLAASQAKLSAQKEAEQILRDVRDRAAVVKETAEVEALELHRQTRDKNRAMIEESEGDVDRILAEARADAAKIRSEADDILERARTHIRDRGENLLREATEQAEKTRAAAISDAGRVRDEARAEGLRNIEASLREAHLEIQRIKDASRAEIEALQTRQFHLQSETAEAERRKADFLTATEASRRSAEEARLKHTEVADLLGAARAELAKAQTDFEQTSKEQEEAELARDQSLKARREAEADTEKWRREVAERKNDLNKELQEIRQRGLLDFENRKKDEEKVIAAQKLKWLDEMKAIQMEEERQQRTLKAHQAVELGRHLELLIVPLVSNAFPGKEKEITPILTGIIKELGPVVKRVLLEEQSAQGSSEIENVISADPIIEKMKKRERLRARLMFTVPMAAFILAIYTPSYFEFLRRPIDFINGGKSIAELAAERRAREIASKPKFDPPLIDQLGSTYTDSVLYTRNYLSDKLSPDNQKKWVIELEKFMVRDLGLPEQATVGYVSVETRMLKELHQQRALVNPEFESEGITRMRDIERPAIVELKGKVGGDVAYDKIRAYEKKFFETIRAPASE